MWYKSRVLWFNVLVASLVALEATYPMVEEFLPANIYVVGAIVLAVGNAALRTISVMKSQLKG